MEITRSVEELEKFELTDEQREKVYLFASNVSKETIDEVCPALLNLAISSEKGLLKNELGKVIFHLQKNERLNTMMGLQKLLEAGLIAYREEMFKVLESSDDNAKELAKKIKQVL